MPDWIAIVDTREQHAFDLERFGVECVSQKLDSGDYSIAGYERDIAIERKSASDLLGCIGKGRERFVRELTRLADMQYAAVVCESPIDAVLSGEHRSFVSPASVMGSVIAWEQRFGIHWHFCPSRPFAERLTFKILDRFFYETTNANPERQIR